jgi:NAD(P)-dependent dehydrogenase (short-subunit alcohol dehydrogenase family)
MSFTKINQLINFKNKTAIITGAGGFLGKRIAYTLGKLNCNLILVDQHSVNIKYKNNKIHIQKYKCNFEDREDILKFISDVKKNNKKIEILINNASYTGSTLLNNWAVDFKDQDSLNWDRAIQVGLTTAFELSKAFQGYLKKNKGVIINIGSIYCNLSPNKNNYVKTKMKNPAAYSVSKSGLLQLTKWLAVYLSPKIRVNMISPGGIYRKQPKIFINKYNSRVPLQRMCREDDLDGAIIFLASQLSNYITGHNLIVDGGYSIC